MTDPQIIEAVSRTAKTMADGTLRLTFDIAPTHAKQAFSMFGMPELPVAIARLTQQASLQSAQDETINAESFGPYANALYKSGWFYAPGVIQAFGTDDEFLEWVKGLPCACASPECHGDVVAAHVRRINQGAGVGIKPEYSAIPLCHHHHHLQHQHGESAIGGKDRVDEMARLVRIDFIKDSIYQTFNVLSLTELNFDDFVHFCEEKNIFLSLPAEFKK